jgi:hypothetical protein
MLHVFAAITYVFAQVGAGEEEVASGRRVKDEVVAKGLDHCLALYDALALER